MDYYLELIYSTAEHYKAIIFTLLLGFFFIDYGLPVTTVESKHISSMTLTNEFTQDSVEVRHLVLRDSNGKLSVMNNITTSVKAGQRVIFIKQEGRLTGITYEETIKVFN